jgi:hypothetical protein
MVVPDGGSQGQQSLQHPGDDTLGGVSSVSLQVELAFQGLVDRLDELTERLQELGPRPGSLALLGRSNESSALGGQEVLELGTGVSLVGQDDLTPTIGELIRIDLEEVTGDLPFIDLGIGQGKGHRETGRSTDQMQPQPPEVAGVAGTETVTGEPGKLASPGRRTGASALDRRGVDHPGLVVPEVGVSTEHTDQGVELGLGLPEPLVVAGLVEPAWYPRRLRPVQMQSFWSTNWLLRWANPTSDSIRLRPEVLTPSRRCGAPTCTVGGSTHGDPVNLQSGNADSGANCRGPSRSSC